MFEGVEDVRGGEAAEDHATAGHSMAAIDGPTHVGHGRRVLG